MPRLTKRQNSHQFSISFPKPLVEEIDIICKADYISRSSWLLAASKEKLERDRIKKIEKFKREVEDNKE